MYSLFIDTHLADINIVLYRNGILLNKLNKTSKQSHSEFSVAMIEEILGENEIKSTEIGEIIVVNGPGSFTAIRIGVTIAKVMAYSLNIPIKVVSSLQLIAFSTSLNEKITVVSEKNGHYIGHFDSKNILIESYFYIKNSSYSDFLSKNDLTLYTEEDVDYKKIYEWISKINPVNVHAANPIYIKDIEVVNG